jgi:hypothetical protein
MFKTYLPDAAPAPATPLHALLPGNGDTPGLFF